MAGYVLIVESDPDLQKRIGDALREARYELASEAEGAWAKRSVAVRTPDAVVLDTRLGDGDGFQVAEELRRDPDTRHTPIFFIASTHRGASHRAEARRRFGPAEYLSTPLDVNSLLAMLLSTVQPGEGAPARVPTPAPVATDPAQERERRHVERSARTLAAEKVELQGTLKRVPFARLVQRLYGQRATGSLLLLRDPTKKIASFVDGFPVSVRSNVLAECLGQILLSQHLISEEVLAESVARMQHEKRQQGQILLEMGALSPFNLQRALIEQAQAKFFEVFSWRDGKFLFKEGEPAPADAQRLDKPPAALILEGIRRHYDAARQGALLGSYARQYLILSPDPMLRLQEMTADATELAFIRTIDGTARLETVLEGAQIPRDKARLLVVALLEAGMIQATDAPPSRRKGSVPPTGGSVSLSGVVSAAMSSQSSGPLPGGSLAMVVETVRTQDYFWALGVGRGATTEEIDHAYETLARSFHADRYRNSSEEDRRVAQEIFDRLGEAHRLLRDPVRRRSYVAKLSKGDKADKADRSRERDREIERRERTFDIKLGADAVVAAAANSAPNTAARALYEVGQEHLRARRHHEAVEVFRQAARLVPNEAEYRASLGWALFREAPADARAGRAALAELRRALQLDPRNRRALKFVAELYAQTGQPELAIQELERLLAIDPTAADAAEELRRLQQSVGGL